MNYYLLILRILHIGAGVYWVGSTLLLALVITPALKATGGSGQKFIDYLITKKRFGTESAGAGGMTGLAGFLLYWHDSQGFTSAWMDSSAGIGFGVGALFGLIAFIFGVLTDRRLKAMAQLREQLESAPSDETTSQLQELEKQQTTYLNICAVTLTLSLWIMAVARYLVF
ncbi:MAG TPA: hypothetical protein VK851_15290 [Anaerolineales bacterium]|nr:hypothetical protein [Anaerolineales bacterium]